MTAARRVEEAPCGIESKRYLIAEIVSRTDVIVRECARVLPSIWSVLHEHTLGRLDKDTSHFMMACGLDADAQLSGSRR